MWQSGKYGIGKAWRWEGDPAVCFLVFDSRCACFADGFYMLHTAGEV